MIKKDMWTISHEDSSVCFQYGYENAAIFQGNFRYFSGMVLADENYEALDFMLYVESATIQSAESNHNSLLRSADYFDSMAYPVMIFHSGHSIQPGDGRLINAQLTLKGIAKPVQIEVVKVDSTPHPTEDRVLMIANAVLSASDFEVGIRELHDPDDELTFVFQLILKRPFRSKN